jgi:hypothetical protein
VFGVGLLCTWLLHACCIFKCASSHNANHVSRRRIVTTQGHASHDNGLVPSHRALGQSCRTIGTCNSIRQGLQTRAGIQPSTPGRISYMLASLFICLPFECPCLCSCSAFSWLLHRPRPHVWSTLPLSTPPLRTAQPLLVKTFFVTDPWRWSRTQLNRAASLWHLMPGTLFIPWHC